MPIVNNIVFYPEKFVKRINFKLSVLTTKKGEFLEVMDMFMILIVVMVSQVYTRY